MAKVTTGTGDDGYTSLLGAQRVPKYDARPDTFGTIDEATSALGLARAQTEDERVSALILHTQRDLYVLMAELATPPEHRAAVGMRITAEHVAWLERPQEELSYEVTSTGQVSAATIFRYLEHVATLASADRGFDSRWYVDHGAAWVVREMQVRFGRLPGIGDELQLATWVSEFRRVQAQREYAVCLADSGRLVARASARWAYVDR